MRKKATNRFLILFIYELFFTKIINFNSIKETKRARKTHVLLRFVETLSTLHNFTGFRQKLLVSSNLSERRVTCFYSVRNGVDIYLQFVVSVA